MKGIKRILFGIALILIAGFFIVSQDSNLGGLGELILIVLGLMACIQGLRTDD